MNYHINRREFLKQGSISAIGMAMFPAMIRKVAPSDRLRIAQILC